MRPSVEWAVRRVSAATKPEVEPVDRRGRGDGGGRAGRDDPQLGLGRGQGDEDVEPGLEPAPFVEDGPQLLGPPEVGVLLGVGQAGDHAGSAVAATRCSPSRTRSSEAPHGTVTVVPSRSMCSSSRQHLVSTGMAPPARAASPPRAEVDRLRLLPVEPAVELAGPGAAEQHPALLSGRSSRNRTSAPSSWMPDPGRAGGTGAPGVRWPARRGRPGPARARRGAGPRRPRAPAGPGRGASPATAARPRPPGPASGRARG